MFKFRICSREQNKRNIHTYALSLSLCIYIYIYIYIYIASVVLAANLEIPGSIPGATRFSAYQRVWNGVYSALARINEELLETKVAARSRKLRLTTVGDLPR
jgi:hypothetical protein